MGNDALHRLCILGSGSSKHGDSLESSFNIYSLNYVSLLLVLNFVNCLFEFKKKHAEKPFG